MHEIGAMVWFQGSEYMIFTPPYSLHGHMWQDAEGHGKVVAVPTPEQQAENVAQQQSERATEQQGFRNLKDLREWR